LAIFVGPSLSFGYSFQKIIPHNSQDFPIQDRDVRIGLGARTDLRIKVGKKMNIILGTKLTLLDVGYNNKFIQNPNLTIRQQRNHSIKASLPRQQFLLQLGLAWQIAEKRIRTKRTRTKRK